MQIKLFNSVFLNVFRLLVTAPNDSRSPETKPPRKVSKTRSLRNEGQPSPLPKYFHRVEMNRMKSREKEERERSKEHSEGMEERAGSQDGTEREENC